MSAADRHVHASLTDGSVVVRYGRSGRYYREFLLSPRQEINLGAAVDLAMAPGSKVRLNVPGGRRFDALYRRMTQNKNQENA